MLPEVNVLPNPSATAGNRIPQPRLLVGSFLLSPFRDSPAWLLLGLPAKVPCPPPTRSAWPLRALRPLREERRRRRRRYRPPLKVEHALPARGGMCNASESRGSVSGEEVPFPLCVRDTKTKWALVSSALPGLPDPFLTQWSNVWTSANS